jgi:hypothetical protein
VEVKSKNLSKKQGFSLKKENYNPELKGVKAGRRSSYRTGDCHYMLLRQKPTTGSVHVGGCLLSSCKESRGDSGALSGFG